MRKRLANRIFARPQQRRRVRADDRHRRFERRLLLGESASAKEWNTEQLEVVRRHEARTSGRRSRRRAESGPRGASPKSGATAGHRDLADSRVARQRLVGASERCLVAAGCRAPRRRRRCSCRDRRRRSCAPFRTSVAATISSTSDTVTWPVMSRLRSVLPRTRRVSWPRSASVSVTRVACSAGSSANSMVAAPASSEREQDDPQIEVERHQPDAGGDARRQHRDHQERADAAQRGGERQRRRRPRAARSAGLRSGAGARSRPRLAPIESRMPISRWRALARASITFEALAHAATSTSPNATKTGERTAEPLQRHAHRRRAAAQLALDRIDPSADAGFDRLERHGRLRLRRRHVVAEPSRVICTRRSPGGQRILARHEDAVHRDRHPRVAR